MWHQVLWSLRTSAQFKKISFKNIDYITIIMNVIIVTIFLIFKIKACDVSCNGYKPRLQMEDFKFKYGSQWSSFSLIVFHRWIFPLMFTWVNPQEENDIWYFFLMELGPTSLLKLFSKIKWLVLNIPSSCFYLVICC
jgi:hypothetical protein